MAHDEKECQLCRELLNQAVRAGYVLVPLHQDRDMWCVVLLCSEVGVTDTNTDGWRAWLVGEVIYLGTLQSCYRLLAAELDRLHPLVAAHCAWRAKQDGVEMG